MARHPTDLLSLGFGLLFAAIGIALLSGDLELPSLEWVAPLAAVIIGALLILTGRTARTHPDEPSPEA
jgi:hypothetical protein